MLSDAELQQHMQRLGLSAEAQQVVAAIRSSPPSRAVTGRAGNVCVRYPSRKMGVTIQAESHRVKLGAIYLMEHDPAVLEYYDQPPALTLTYRSPTDRNVTVRHTPDFFVIRTDGIVWEEWKPAEAMPALTARMPNRYVQDADGTWRCPPGEQAVATFGGTYRVRTSAEINWTVQRNLRFLGGVKTCMKKATSSLNLVKICPFSILHSYQKTCLRIMVLGRDVPGFHHAHRIAMQRSLGTRGKFGSKNSYQKFMRSKDGRRKPTVHPLHAHRLPRASQRRMR